MKAKVFLLEKLYEGYPKEDDYRLIEEDLRELNDGEFLAEAEYISVDPYMRSFIGKRNVGKTVISEQVAKIIESKNSDYPTGSYIVGELGWRTHTISDGKTRQFSPLNPRPLPDLQQLPRSLALGICGMPGNTAYFGLLNHCRPQAGETVVVSAAGGAVGSAVAQIAKIKGCKVIGIAGTDEKGEWLLNDLGIDGFVNYKSGDFEQKLIDSTADKIDCYFDNVGGEISSTVLNRMNKFGRVACCGAISTYNDVEPSKTTEIQTPIKINHLKMEGVNVFSYKNQWNEGIEQNLDWIREGRLKYHETITEGFENLPKAFIGMLKGANIGKAIVKVL